MFAEFGTSPAARELGQELGKEITRTNYHSSSLAVSGDAKKTE
jgi:hypothetical protein